MNRFHFIHWLMAICVASMSTSGIAQTTGDLCRPQGVVAGFYNGVWNTTLDAKVGALALEVAIGGTRTAGGEEIRWEVFYNTTTTGWADLVETFNQRASAQDQVVAERWEIFWEAISGNGRSSGWSGVISDSISSLSDFFAGIENDVLARTIATLTFSLKNPPTIDNYTEHKSKIDNFALEGKKFLMVAHSQGNLFVVQSYDYAVSKVGAQAVGVVHIAPASPNLRGDYTLADLDLVINALRATGSVPANNVQIPGIAVRPAPVDASGHTLIDTYLHADMAPRAKIVAQMIAAANALQPPNMTSNTLASPGFFTVTLTWSGTGDVDLYTYEPGGSKVYFAAKAGISGFLDVDNVVANGPEHYYASCDSSRVVTGSYRVSIDNYSAPAGLIATLQVSAFDGGVLFTKVMAVPGTPSFGQSPVSALIVDVTKDSTTGKLTAVAH